MKIAASEEEAEKLKKASEEAFNTEDKVKALAAELPSAKSLAGLRLVRGCAVCGRVPTPGVTYPAPRPATHTHAHAPLWLADARRV